MKIKITLSLLLLIGAVTCSNLVHAAEAAPVPVVTQAEYNDAANTIARSFRRQAQSAVDGYMKIFDDMPGLNENMRFDLFRRLLVRAFELEGDIYTTQLARFWAEPDNGRKYETLRLLIRDFVKTGGAEFVEADRLYREHEENFTARQRIYILADLSMGGLRYDGELESFQMRFKAVEKMTDPSAESEQAQASFEQFLADKLVEMISGLMRYDDEAAAALMKAVGERLSDAQRLALDHGLIEAALGNADRKAFDAALANFEKNPDAVAKLAHYSSIASGLYKSDPDAAVKIVRTALARPEYDSAQRQGLLAILCRLQRPRYFKYGGFYELGDYETYRALADENVAEIERALADESMKFNRNVAVQFHDFAVTAAEFGDYAFSAAMLAKARENYPTDFAFVSLALQLALHANTLEAVRAVVDPLLADEKQSESNKTFLKAVLFIYEGKDFKKFDAEVYGEQAFTAADRMLLIRRAGEVSFRGDRYDLARRAHDEVFNNMFSPVLYKSYDVQYVDRAPRTAEAWASSPHYANWKAMETRFVRYGDGYDMNNSTDIARNLKDAEAPVVPDAYRTGAHILCDDSGLHIYVRCENPDVAAIVAGQMKGEALELLFRPSEDAAYHSWYFDSAPLENGDKHLVNWASPSPRYRLTYDFFEKDSTATPEAIVAHTYIPWMAFHDNLPIGDYSWKFGMQRWGKHSVTLNGSVHELARALQLKFALTPAQEIAIKRQTALVAFNRYNQDRQNKGGFIQTWNDPVLGDSDFYASELEALIADLDAAGARLIAPAPDAEINDLYANYASRWAEISYLVADLRNAYLRKQLLK